MIHMLVANAVDTATGSPRLPFPMIEQVVLIALITPIPPPLAVVPTMTAPIAAATTTTESLETTLEETGVIIPRAVPSKVITAVAARDLIKLHRATALLQVIAAAVTGPVPPEDLMAPAEVERVTVAIDRVLRIGRIEVIDITTEIVARPAGGIGTMIIMMRFQDLLRFLSARVAD